MAHLPYYPYLENIAYVSVPKLYAEQVIAFLDLKPGSVKWDDCHTELEFDSLKYDFVEIEFDPGDVEGVITRLAVYNIPFLLQHTFEEDLWIRYVLFMNPQSINKVVAVKSTDTMLYPQKGKLGKLAKEAMYNYNLVAPVARVINRVMSQQVPIFKLTGTVETLSEYRYKKPKE